jgi:hypothetical protein
VEPDLSAIPGLKPKHLTVLAGPLHITTARDLAQADRRVVHAALRRLRPAPTLEEIAVWQDHARDLAQAASPQAASPQAASPQAASPPAASSSAPGAPDPGALGPGAPGWEQAAAFVVSFEQRAAGDAAERRVVVEQVEQVPPEPRQEWPEWQREPAWAWMLERLGSAPGETTAGTAGPPPGPASPATGRPAGGRKPPAPAPPSPPPPAARITAKITASPLELTVPAGPARPLDPSGPAADVPDHAVLRVTVRRPANRPVLAAVLLREPGRPARPLDPPVPVEPGHPAEISLGRLPPGEHIAVLALWDPQGRAAPAVLSLPRLRAGHARGQGPAGPR